MSTNTETTIAKTDVVNPQEPNLPAVRPREVRVVKDESQLAYIMDTARFEHAFRIATTMASASLIPEHLVKDKGGFLTFEQVRANCFLIVNQSIRWEFDPFACAPETYVVGGKLGFQGKLIGAVINCRGGLKQDLQFAFAGKGDDRAIVVYASKYAQIAEVREKLLPAVRAYAESGNDADNDAIEALGFLTVRMTVKEGKTTNQMWTKDPDQKLVYSGSTKWARRHSPQIMLGVYTDDDLDRIKEEEKKKLTPAPDFGDGKQLPAPETKAKREPKEKAIEPKLQTEPAPQRDQKTGEPLSSGSNESAPGLTDAEKEKILAQEASAGQGDDSLVAKLKSMLDDQDAKEQEFIEACVASGALRKPQSFESITETLAAKLVNAFTPIMKELAKIRAAKEEGK